MSDRPCLTFAYITDLHIGFDEISNQKAVAAVSDLADQDVDLVSVGGDLADFRQHLWKPCKEMFLDKCPRPMIVSRGNADYAAGGDAAWLHYVGQPVRHAVSMGGVRVIALGSANDDHCLSVGADAGEYLKAELGAHPNEVGVILCHAPVQDTTYWSCRNRDDLCLAGLLSPDNPPFYLFLAESESIAAALRAIPNARLFLTGHVHNDNRMKCDHGYGQVSEKDGVLHIVSANVGGWVGVGRERREYRVFDITPDRIRMRTRDFLSKSWVDELEQTFPLYARTS